MVVKMKLRHTFKDSSRVARGTYDTERTEIELEFQDGGRATYRQVPKSVWDELVTASSAGRYINDVLNSYPYVTE